MGSGIWLGLGNQLCRGSCLEQHNGVGGLWHLHEEGAVDAGRGVRVLSCPGLQPSSRPVHQLKAAASHRLLDSISSSSSSSSSTINGGATQISDSIIQAGPALL